MEAVKSGDLNKVKDLIEQGTDVNAYFKYVCTPIFVAVWERHWDIVRCLVDQNANLELVHLFTGHTPLWIAAYQDDHLEMLTYLASKHAKVDAKDCWGRTSLHLAAWKHNLELVQMLVDLGADVNAADDDGLTAVHFASKELNAGI